jgi:hypothetical protein
MKKREEDKERKRREEPVTQNKTRKKLYRKEEFQKEGEILSDLPPLLLLDPCSLPLSEMSSLNHLHRPALLRSN